jgi:hypothetical protein
MLSVSVPSAFRVAWKLRSAASFVAEASIEAKDSGMSRHIRK